MKEVGGAVFPEPGNVVNRVTNIDFGELRAAAGVGVA